MQSNAEKEVKAPALYEITEGHKQLQRLMDEFDDDSREAAFYALNAYEAEFKTKATNVAAVIANAQVMHDNIKNLEERLCARRRRIAKKIEWLKEYLMENMKAMDIRKIESLQFDIILRKKPMSVFVMPGTELPPELLRVKTTTEPDKKALKELLESGAELPGVYMLGGYMISIK
uniref:Uncharacterized protein n=1 Tax=viral metagenome TaxID=1070528 RepID=A0A6M3J1U2_9ZZZZ